MPTGTVVFFHSRKGYGFIKKKNSSANVFVHMDDVDGPDLTEGESVEFDIEQAPKGLRATNVKRVDTPKVSLLDLIPDRWFVKILACLFVIIVFFEFLPRILSR